VGLSSSDVLVLVAEQRNLDRAQAAIMARLARQDLASAVVTPCPVGRWDPSLARYLIASDPTVERDPVVPADEMHWLVAVRPASPFDWRATRAALAARGRTTLRETGESIEVGARDEDDALDLIAELSEVPAVGGAEAERLGWFRRWRVRQQLIGNYSGISDPTLPP